LSKGVGTQGFHLISKLGHFLRKLWRFGTGHPFQRYPLRVNSGIFEQQSDDFKSCFCFIITILVMTFVKMSPHYHDTIGTFFQGVDN
jgi:hypothetical protein